MEIGAIVVEAGRIVVCPRRVVVGFSVNATVVATGAIIRVNAGNLSNLSQSSTMMKFHKFQLETAQSLLLYHWCCRRVIHSRSSFIDHEVNVILKYYILSMDTSSCINVHHRSSHPTPNSC